MLRYFARTHFHDFGVSKEGEMRIERSTHVGVQPVQDKVEGDMSKMFDGDDSHPFHWKCPDTVACVHFEDQERNTYMVEESKHFECVHDWRAKLFVKNCSIVSFHHRQSPEKQVDTQDYEHPSGIGAKAGDTSPEQIAVERMRLFGTSSASERGQTALPAS